jgi:hypothetical protein
MARRALSAFVLLALMGAGARAQVPSGDEVPYIQTPRAVVDKMLELAEVGPEDFLIDLGSGDGRIVIAAAQRRGARGFGVELDTRLVEESNAAARKAGVAERAQFFARDLFATDIAQASVLTMYLLPEFNLQLRPRILAELRPGARVVSHDWDMGDWQPDAKVVLEGVVKPVMPIRSSTVFLWIVPAIVAGAWTLHLDGAPPMELELSQRFQMISGAAKGESGSAPLQDAGLRGTQIRFALSDAARSPSAPLQFTGRVHGERMDGTTAGGRRWTAARKGN